tara:strand:+ start:8152 stop:8340 length:189 start_codon:yes stop_codon:yes gene_type:complete
MNLYLILPSEGAPFFRSSRAYLQSIRNCERRKRKDPDLQVHKLEPGDVRVALDDHAAAELAS